MRRGRIYALVLLGACGALCSAATLYVSATTGNDAWNGLCPAWNGGTCGPKATIQAGIDAAANGDTVLVADGTYVGVGNRNLSTQGKLITVQSERGPATCIIDCLALGRGFTISSMESAQTVIAGFTITRGTGKVGGAISCNFANPTIRDCVLTGNAATTNGGALWLFSSAPVVRDCQIIGNTCRGAGGGIYGTTASDATIINCTVTGNTTLAGGGGVYFANSQPSLINCTISGNRTSTTGGGLFASFRLTLINCLVNGNAADTGGGLDIRGANVTIRNCCISGNRAVSGGGGLFTAQSGTASVANAIFWNNAAPLGPQLAVGTGTVLNVHHCDVEGGSAAAFVGQGATLEWLTGNLDVNPLFAAPGHWDDAGTPEDPGDDVWVDGDYHLQSGAPVIDAGDNTAVPRDQFDLNHNGNTLEPLPYDRDNARRFVDDPRTPDSGTGTPPIVDLGPYEFWPDCNGNDVPDDIDIATGTSTDTNSNGIPDECEPKLTLSPSTLCVSDQIAIHVMLQDIQQPVVGGQFFLQYNANLLELLGIDPGDPAANDPQNPFGREIFAWVDPAIGQIDYAVGIFDGSQGTVRNVPVATIRFARRGDACQAANLVRFRDHYPATRLAGELGVPIVPELIPLPVVTLDGTPPDLTLPPDITIPAGSPTTPTYTGWASAVDNCDPNPAVDYADQWQGEQLHRTWMTFDACGLQSQGVQVITVLDCSLAGDLDCDHNVDVDDLVLFGDCLAGPDISTPPPTCTGDHFQRADLEFDDDVDLADFAALQRLATGS